MLFRTYTCSGVHPLLPKRLHTGSVNHVLWLRGWVYVKLERRQSTEGWQAVYVVKYDRPPHLAGAVKVFEEESAMKLPPEVTSGANLKPLAAATGRLKKLPELAGFLLARGYEGSDKIRVPGTMSVYPSEVGFRVILKDPTTKSQLLFQVDDWDQIETTAEALLGSKDCPWQPDTFASQKKRR